MIETIYNDTNAADVEHAWDINNVSILLSPKLRVRSRLSTQYIQKQNRNHWVDRGLWKEQTCVNCALYNASFSLIKYKTRWNTPDKSHVLVIRQEENPISEAFDEWVIGFRFYFSSRRRAFNTSQLGRNFYQVKFKYQKYFRVSTWQLTFTRLLFIVPSPWISNLPMLRLSYTYNSQKRCSGGTAIVYTTFIT